MKNGNQDHRSRGVLALLTGSVLSVFMMGHSVQASSMLAHSTTSFSTPMQVSIANCPDCLAAAQKSANSGLLASLAQTARDANNAAEYLGAPVGGGSTPNKNSPIGFTAMKVTATPNWDVFSGQPLPGSLNAQNEAAFDPGFHASYWNGLTFQDVDSAPWRQFLDPTDAQEAYAFGEMISNPGYSFDSYGFVPAGEWPQ